MREVTFDTETDGFDYTTLHCTAANGVLLVGAKELEEWYKDEGYDGTELWIAHNACGFDYWAVNTLTDLTIRPEQIVDTSVLSKLKDYNKYRTHSLDEIGESLGHRKSEYTGGFERYTPTMGAYCLQDERVLQAVWKNFRPFYRNPAFAQAIRTEHDMALICHDIQANGFKFNRTKAEELLSEVTAEMNELEEAMSHAWPPRLVEDRRIQWRMKKDGTPHASCLKAMDSAPKWEIEGDELILYGWKTFNPGSSKDRIDVLWDAGWKPYDKTKGHILHERSKRRW